MGSHDPANFHTRLAVQKQTNAVSTPILDLVRTHSVAGVADMGTLRQQMADDIAREVLSRAGLPTDF